KPQVAFRETIRRKGEAQGKYVRQTGGRGQYGDVYIEVEPNEPGGGFVFENKIVGGAVPREYVPAVEKGIKEAMETGVLAGYPMVDIKVYLTDGSYHDAVRPLRRGPDRDLRRNHGQGRRQAGRPRRNPLRTREESEEARAWPRPSTSGRSRT